MLLGKRARPPMKRTTSMSEITFDLNGEATPAPSDPFNTATTTTTNNNFNRQNQKPAAVVCGGGGGGGFHSRFLSTVSPRTSGRRLSADFLETPHFLRACGLCKRRLVPGRDIYMYRGDTAFCSLECRQQQMNHDERKEKCSMASKKEAVTSSKGGSSVSTKGETTVTAL